MPLPPDAGLRQRRAGRRGTSVTAEKQGGSLLPAREYHVAVSLAGFLGLPARRTLITMLVDG